jgi:hypothetical protein
MSEPRGCLDALEKTKTPLYGIEPRLLGYPVRKNAYYYFVGIFFVSLAEMIDTF